MTAAVECPFCPNPLISPQLFGTSGVSDESESIKAGIDEQAKESMLARAAETSLSRSEQALEKLFEIYRECDSPNWNGRDALPISIEAVEDVIKLIALIPEKYPMPEIIPEPTGEIGLEWYLNPYKVLLLSLPGDGFINYAGLYGYKNAENGTKPINAKLDAKLYELLERTIT